MRATIVAGLGLALAGTLLAAPASASTGHPYCVFDAGQDGRDVYVSGPVSGRIAVTVSSGAYRKGRLSSRPVPGYTTGARHLRLRHGHGWLTVAVNGRECSWAE
jgi:hypothetical protein